MWGARSPSPQQQRPPQQQQHQQQQKNHQQHHQRPPQQQSPRPQQQSPRPQQPPSQGTYHPFQTLQMPKQPSVGAIKVVPSFGENTPPSSMFSPPKVEGSRHIVSANNSPAPQMVKSPPQLITKASPTPMHHAIIIPIESPGRSSSASKDGGMQRVHVQNSSSNVATGNDDSPQKPLIPFGNSHAVNNNRMSPSTIRRGSGSGGGGQTTRQPLQASRDLHPRPLYQEENHQQEQQEQQEKKLSSSLPSAHRMEMGKANDFTDPIEASNVQVQALRSEIARLKNLAADEEKIEQNRYVPSTEKSCIVHTNSTRP